MQPSSPQVAPEVAAGAGARGQVALMLGSQWWRQFMLVLLLLAGLLALDTLCYAVALPVSVSYAGGQGTLHVGTQTIPLGRLQQPTELVLVPRDPVVHEYQLDGTDSADNFTLDTVYLDEIANTPYYRFQAWMRDLDGTSVWRDARVTQGGQVVTSRPQVTNGASLPLPFSGDFTIDLQLQRPESPAVFSLVLANGNALNVTLDRNDHVIRIVSITGPGQAGQAVKSVYFPQDPMPFVAMVVDFLTRTTLWAVLLVLAVFVVQAATVLGWGVWEQYAEPFLARTLATEGDTAPSALSGEDAGGPALALPAVAATDTLAPSATSTPAAGATGAAALPREAARGDGQSVTSAGALPGGRDGTTASSTGGTTAALLTVAGARVRGAWAALTAAIHPVGVAALGFGFVLTCWIALAQYNALPHIYDEVAYVFAAKMYAIGRLSVPAPAAAQFFPGPFMGVYRGQWFTQYPPGTSALLALGLRFGVPWLIEPVMGTLALLGIGLIAARLFSRRVATIAVLLGVLSPFYAYLAASYLSHTVALCFLVWGFWAVLRFAQGGASWNLPFAAAGFGLGGLTRDFSTVAFGAVVVVGVLTLTMPRWRADWRRALARLAGPALGFLGVALCFVAIYLVFDWRLTGNPFVTPRMVLNPGDRVGFGPGIGFFGQNSVASGVMIVDQLLTALAIDLYGWPFYLTLAFLAVPFLLRRARAADVFLLLGAAVMTAIWVGYFFNGIFLGPRYLTEALPFIFILTARGIVLLGEATERVGRRALVVLRSRASFAEVSALPASARRFGLGAMLTLLVGCSIFYFWPRQLVLHSDFTGMAVGTRVDFNAVEHPPFHNAIIVTGDYSLYGYTLFALNDPLLRGDVLYAFASTQEQYSELQRDFPARAIYVVHVAMDGQVSYTHVAG